MCIEYSQILSVNVHFSNPDWALALGLPCGRRSKHGLLPWQNHPSVVWARRSRQNWLWLFHLWTHTLVEYSTRYGRTHACERHWDALQTSESFGGLIYSKLTPPALAMPVQYHNVDPVKAYRDYYIHEKFSFARWNRGRPAPSWWPHE